MPLETKTQAYNILTRNSNMFVKIEFGNAVPSVQVLTLDKNVLDKNVNMEVEILKERGHV